MKINALYDVEKNHWWFNSRRKIISHLFWNKNNFQKPKILSVGISSGAELDYLSQFGTVTGVDICSEASTHAKKKGYTVINEDISRCTLQNNSHDIVFAMDVLEHIKNHQDALAQITRILKPGGTAIITVPACMFLWSKFDELGDFPHVRRYTKKNLLQLLNTQNLKLEKVSYYNFFLLPLMMLNRKFSKSPELGLKIPNTYLNKILNAIFSSERFFISKVNFPIGASLLAICKKN